MLGLVSHEPHFSLIREDDVLKNNRTKSPVASFHFLHISLVREYISMDFESLKETLPKNCGWDLERIIDDFILLCFLVGNDFLPTLPTLNIADGSLNFILDTYKKVLPRIGDYLTKRGEINLSHLESFFRTFCEGEESNFDVVPFGHEKLDKKKGRGRGRGARKNEKKGANASGPAVVSERTKNAFRALEQSTPADIASVLYAQRQADSDDSEGEEYEENDSETEFSEEEQRSGSTTTAKAQHPRLAALHSETSTPASSASGGSTTTDTSSSSTGYSTDASNDNPLDSSRSITKSLDGLKISTEHPLGEGLFGAEDEDSEAEKELWKITYYRQKLDMDLSDTEAHDKLRTSYLEGLIWVYHYYMHGCISWSWFFPYHYAPLISDLVSIAQYESRIKFERGTPFKPYQQLLGVLPPKSAALLPKPYQYLLLSPDSPLAPYIPETLEIDREGTKNEWEGVTLLPFMDQKIITDASESIPLAALSPEEIRCNTFGNAYTYKYDPNITATVVSPQKELFDDLLQCGSEALIYHHPEASSNDMFSHMENQPPLLNSFYLLPGTHLGANKPPTLPTLFSKKLISNLQKNNTRVLQRPANFASLVVRICDFDDEAETNKARGQHIKFLRRDKRADPISLEMESIAAQYHGQLVYVWPYNREAKVISIMDENGCYDENGDILKGKSLKSSLLLPQAPPQNSHHSQGGHHGHHHHGQNLKNSSSSSKSNSGAAPNTPAREFADMAKESDDFATQQQAVDIGDVRCIFEVVYLHGVSRDSNGALKKQWSETSTLVPFQTILEEVPFGPDPRFLERPAPAIDEQYPIYSSALFVPPNGGATYGVMGTVVDYKEDPSPTNAASSGSLVLNIDQIERMGPLFSTLVIANDFDKWYSAKDLAKMAGIPLTFVGRITSSIILDDKNDLGLQLRFQGRGQQTLGYTKRVESVDRHTGQRNSWWEYSQKTCDLVLSYLEAFPDIFDILVKLPINSVHAHEVFAQSEKKEQEAEKEKSLKTSKSSSKAHKSEPKTKESDEDASDDVLNADSASESSDEEGEGKPKKETSHGRHGRRGTGPQYIREKQMLEWVAQHRPSKSLRVGCGTVGLDQSLIARLEKSLDQWHFSHPEPSNPAQRTLTVPRTHAYSPLPPLEVLHKNSIDAVGRADFRLAERAVYVLNSGSVPFGTMGTIVTVSKTHVELLLDSPCIGATDLSGRCSHRRGISVPHGAVINISAPVRKSETGLRRSGNVSQSSPQQNAWSTSSSDRIRSSAGGSDVRKGTPSPSNAKGGNKLQHSSGSSNQAHAKKSGGPNAQDGHKDQGGAKKVAIKDKNASSSQPKQAAGQQQDKNASTSKQQQKQSAKNSAAAKAEAPAGKPVAVGDLFAAGDSAASASSTNKNKSSQGVSASAQAEPAHLPGVSMDAQQLSFFNALSAGQGMAFAQQNMPSVPQMHYGMPNAYAQPMMPPMMMMAPHQPYAPQPVRFVPPSAPIHLAPAPQQAPSSSQPPQNATSVDDIFRQTAAKKELKSSSIPLDSILPEANPPASGPSQ